jgi:hypothetical protein
LVGVEKKEVSNPDLEQLVLSFVEENTAGSPTDEKVKWTHLSFRDIRRHLLVQHQLKVANRFINRVLQKQGYRKRKPPKELLIGKSPHREEQFRILCFLAALFWDMGNNPILSIDTKKKEALGLLTRNEPILSKDGKAPKVYSHDYSYLATGKAIPHGIYDVKLNRGYISIGNSHETAAFLCDNLRWWWNDYGHLLYPNATVMLLTCDSGGANGFRHHLFKKELLALSREIGIRIVVAHYPPYCSKYNPIERKLFSHVHQTLKGTILTDLEQVKMLMQKTHTGTGLRVEVRIVDKFYPIKLPSRAADVDSKRILVHPTLPQFSYTILP